jgi:hypothetical protein
MKKFTAFALLFALVLVKNIESLSEDKQKSFLLPLVNSVIADPEFVALDGDLQKRVLLNIYKMIDPDFGRQDIDEGDHFN